MADRFEELIENAIQILLENIVTKTTEKLQILNGSV